MRLSIVIPSFNQGPFIEETLQSLFDQKDITPDELEIIVIDGGSTDDSKRIIEAHADRLAYWVSEPDDGQTHALIKGFEIATGDIVGWLCSDDLLESTTVRQVLDFFTARPEQGFVYGDACWIDRQGNFIRWKKEIPFNWFIWVYDHNYIPQPSAFWRRDLYDRVGGLNKTYNLAMDADLWSRFAGRSWPVHVRSPWSRMRLYPEQKNQRLRRESNIEDAHIRRALGFPMDGAARRWVLYLMAKSIRIAWRLWAGCFLRPGPTDWMAIEDGKA